MPETFDFECQDPSGTCGKDGKGFVSKGWPTKEARDERARQHAAEHETKEPMPELVNSGLRRF